MSPNGSGRQGRVFIVGFLIGFAIGVVIGYVASATRLL
jgi:hypothetical protein